MKSRIGVIVGSTRPGSQAKVVADWYIEKSKDISDLVFEAIYIGEQNLPFLDEPNPPASGRYTKPHTIAWSKKIASYDGYVWVTPEYNHSVPAALKNAIDFLYREWVRKPVALVSYGSMGGVRAAEHLRQIAAELQMVALRPAIMIMQPWAMVTEKGDLKQELVHGDHQAQLQDLKWWVETLKNAKREEN